MLRKEFKFSMNTFLYKLNLLKWYKTEPNGDGEGAYYNEKGVFDSNKNENHTVVCVQKIACKLVPKVQELLFVFL